MNRIYILASFFMASCAGQDVMRENYSAAFSRAVPVCEVLSHPRKYLGNEIDVGGLYAHSPHERILYDPSCSSGELSIQIADDDESIKSDHKMYNLLKSRKGKGIRSVYRGFIKSGPLIGNCSDDFCFRYSIDHAILLAKDTSQ